MRQKVQALYHDPASLYGFRLAPDALETLTADDALSAPAAPPTAVDGSRMGRMIRRNRDGLG